MYPGVHAAKTPDKVAYRIAESGRRVTYRELDERSNRGAHLLRSLGLRRGDHVAVCMENNEHYFPVCWAAQRAGLYYTAISSRLTPPEVEYIVNDCGAKVMIASLEKRELAAGLAGRCPGLVGRFLVDGAAAGFADWAEACARFPATPIADESEGAPMLYSSGTTGRPKGVKHPLPEGPIGSPPALVAGIMVMYGGTADSVYLSPAPLYHAAPLRWTMGVQRLGGTVVVMEKFDAEAALAAIEKYRVTDSQWVPTHFVRMLKLAEEVRTKYDLSTHKRAIHAAAPCPVDVKHAMIDWWGPIILEYYAGSEGNGMTFATSQQWLEHPGSVGKPIMGVPHICDDDGNEVLVGEEGVVFFENENQFAYHNDPEKTAEATHARGWTTLGDIGKLDEDGFLYLTDRRSNMIISGGVNIYPQEIENLLITHPKVTDDAVIGAPDPDMGERVVAVVQPADMGAAGEGLKAELLDYLGTKLARLKLPREIDFRAELPREANGKLYKRKLKDEYRQRATQEA